MTSYQPFCSIPSRVRSQAFTIAAGDALGKTVLAPLVYIGLNVTVSNGEGVKFEEASGLANVLARVLKSKSPSHVGALLGTEQTEEKVTEWLGKAEAVAASFGSSSPSINSAVTELNDFLASSELSSGASATAADFAIYGAVHDLMQGLSSEEQLSISHITRHFVQTQHIFATHVNPLPAAFSAVAVDLDPTPQPLKSLFAAAGEDGTSREDKKKDKKEKKDEKKKSKAERQAARGETAVAGEQQDQDAPSAAAAAAPVATPAAVVAATPTPKASLTAEQAKLMGQVVMRVGLIKKAWAHKEAEKLYVEEIDVGEEGPRTICSGLREFIPEAAMQNRRVIVLCNLKPRNLVGISSNGMVLAASNDTHTAVELLDPPADAVIGERVSFEGVTELKDDILNPKKKIWEAVAEGLLTNENGFAAFHGVPFQTSKGLVKVASLKNCHIG
eukprot:c5072_g1_i2.p1 GENE.c5072_g1_i2~~c5072_g1_i2.p1  ORF type:complete len:458 (+),score=132.51 c5072_g1_i2:40-1374(+)